MSEISELHPKVVWSIFDSITKVPRQSKHEGKIREFLIDFAQRHSLECKTDEIGNVVISKPASKGMESHPKVVLQAHMDMVCDKRGDVEFDFATDAIKTRIVDGWVKADGTTLGADCGIGMAAALAVMADNTLVHPPVEALLTVDEETGLTGAFNIGEGMIDGSLLINLDSEDEGHIFIGCAGGVDTMATFTYRPAAVPVGYKWFVADVSGLAGGHSGDDIEKGRGNANKILGRLLLTAFDRFGLQLAGFDGGNLRNAIPREAKALLGIPAAHETAFRQFADSYTSEVAEELKYTDTGFRLSVDKAQEPDKVIDRATAHNLLLAIQGAANGVISMSHAIEGLVETSTNLATVKMPADGSIEVVSSQRSSIESAKHCAADTLGAIFELAGAKVEHSDGYPGWSPNPDSELLSIAVDCYGKLFGTAPKVRAIHAGLECGLFLEKYPKLDMVSFGPTMNGVHSPDERLEIASVDKFWRLLVAILAAL